MYVVTNEPFEEKVFNQTHFPKAAFFRAMQALGPQALQLEQPGFLLTTGNRGNLLIGPVCHNGDVYSRHCQRRGTVHGSISLLLRFGMMGAVLMTERQVIEMALARGKYRRLRCSFINGLVDVAMLYDDWPPKHARLRTCGIYLVGGTVHPLNPELRASWNRWHVQFELMHQLKDGLLEKGLRDHLLNICNTRGKCASGRPVFLKRPKPII